MQLVSCMQVSSVALVVMRVQSSGQNVTGQQHVQVCCCTVKRAPAAASCLVGVVGQVCTILHHSHPTPHHTTLSPPSLSPQAADALRLTGVGRNEYIALLNTCKSKRLMWRLNKGLARELLPAAPPDIRMEAWWRVAVVNVGEWDKV